MYSIRWKKIKSKISIHFPVMYEWLALNSENLKYSIELDYCSEGMYLVQVKTKSSLYYSKLSIIK